MKVEIFQPTHGTDKYVIDIEGFCLRTQVLVNQGLEREARLKDIADQVLKEAVPLLTYKIIAAIKNMK